MSVGELKGALGTRELSSRDLVEAHLQRIEEINPLANAVVTVDAQRALDSAKIVDDLRSRGRDLPPLSGIPMTHKDIHETAGMRTTFGSPIFAENVPSRDALIIARLKTAGVISTGKTNVPEFAAGAHTAIPLFGTTRNPYDLKRSASGSSGGAAAAIASGIQAAGDGSDTGGSLRLPASFNNIVGLRPSNGWIPHVPPGNPWEWLSQPGFMARNVADVALLMDLCSGPDYRGPMSRHVNSRFSTPDADPDLSGQVIGFVPDLGGRIEIEDEVAAVVSATGPVLLGLGARLSDEVPDLGDAAEVFRIARAYEFASNYGRLVENHSEQMKSSLLNNIRTGLSLEVEDLFTLDAARARLWTAMQDYFSRHDVLVTTTSQVEPFRAEVEYPEMLNGKPVTDYVGWIHATSLISATGCPAISVPAGFSATGLPVGIQIVGPVGGDALVLQVAKAFEAATGHALSHPPL